MTKKTAILWATAFGVVVLLSGVGGGLLLAAKRGTASDVGSLLSFAGLLGLCASTAPPLQRRLDEAQALLSGEALVDRVPTWRRWLLYVGLVVAAGATALLVTWGVGYVRRHGLGSAAWLSGDSARPIVRPDHREDKRPATPAPPPKDEKRPGRGADDAGDALVEAKVPPSPKTGDRPAERPAPEAPTYKGQKVPEPPPVRKGRA